MMRTGPLAPAMFAWILGSESGRGKSQQISIASTFKIRSSVNRTDRDLSGDAGRFCQCPAFSA
jgi:hypothetical protein